MKKSAKLKAVESVTVPPNAGAPPQLTPEEQAKKIAEANESLFTWLSTPTAVYLQGCVSALGNQIRPEYVLYGICEVLGRILGHMYAGDEQAVKNFRGACVSNFTNALTSAPIRPLPQSNAPDANAAA